MCITKEYLGYVSPIVNLEMLQIQAHIEDSTMKMFLGDQAVNLLCCLMVSVMS